MKLVSYQGSLIHPECLTPLNKLDRKLKELGVQKFQVKGCDPSHKQFNPSSAFSTGREFSIETGSPIEVLWSAAIPLGFIPWNRYPIQDNNSHLFHYYGKWSPLVDFLHSEGRGELAWYNFCVASLLEINRWEGNKVTERKLQMHLHRLGIHCGPIDGVIGARTLNALKTLGLAQKKLSESVEIISQWENSKPEATSGSAGHIYLGGRNSTVFTAGQVHAINTGNGYTISIEGQGRIIIEIE